MLDIENALELMKKYGYSSTSVHPYIYQSGEDIGICYTYVDEDYGSLERIKIFDSLESFEEFLKQIDWLKKNGLRYHVRMCLDNYEAINPKTLFLRNEKLMVEGEMDDIELFDSKEAQRDQMDETSKILYEAGDLLLVYEEIKSRQLQYLLKIIELKNQLRQKYFDLQKSVDEYNKVKIEREMVKIPAVTDNGGIDVTMEIALKDKYNMYLSQAPTLEEAKAFLKETWDLNKNLELNERYYDAIREETQVRNEMKIVDKKQALMDKLNENLRPLFGVDLVSRFRKINKSMGRTINTISATLVSEKTKQVEHKYQVYPQLDPMYVSDYLREAIQNSNYEDLAMKYGHNTTRVIAERGRTPLNEIASSLLVQYKNSLSVDEQAILVIYSNPKFRKICNAILAIPKFQNFTPKQIVKKINGIKGFSKLKSECYISLKNRIDNPLNKSVKSSLFRNYDFTSFETFIGSLMKELYKLKEVNNKMHLIGDINMYITVKKVEDISKQEFVFVTNDLNSILTEAKETKSMVGITLLKRNLPVLYSPYYLDLGDIYSKDASPKIDIREMINFELLVDASDIIINIDQVKTKVTNYSSLKEVEGNVSIVRDINANGNVIFTKYAFLPNSANNNAEEAAATTPQPTPVASEVPAEPQAMPVAPVVPVVDQTPPKEPTPEVVPEPVEQQPEEKTDVPVATPVEPVKEEVEKPVPTEIKQPVEEKKEEPKDPIPTATPKEEPKKEEKVVPPVLPKPVPTKVEEKTELPIEKEPVPKKEEEDDLDKLLDTLATTIPKDLSKNLEDTSKMEMFKDLEEKPKVTETPKPVDKKQGAVKEQIVKKIITNPDGTKKVVLVKRIIKPKDEVKKDGINDQPVLPVKKDVPTSTPTPVKKVVKKIGMPDDVNKKVVVKKVAAPIDNK